MYDNKEIYKDNNFSCFAWEHEKKFRIVYYINQRSQEEMLWKNSWLRFDKKLSVEDDRFLKEMQHSIEIIFWLNLATYLRSTPDNDAKLSPRTSKKKNKPKDK